MNGGHPQGLFITGTDTGVGKTVVTAALARGLRAQRERVGIYKPVCSGSEAGFSGKSWGDVEAHFAALGGEFPRERICPQCFDAALAPPLAARAEGRVVDPIALRRGLEWWREECDWLLIEGAGGFLCPLTQTETIADFAVAAGLPVLIVARAGLGTISQTLLTIEAVERRGLPILGVVLNETSPGGDDPSRAGNAGEISRRCGIRVLAEIPYQSRRGLPEGGEALTMDLPEVGELLVRALRARGLFKSAAGR